MNKKAIVVKQMVSYTLAAAMILLILTATWLSAGAETLPFKDVPDGKWYTDAVRYCYGKGYVGGYEDKTFRPNNRLTRAEMAVIMNRKLGLKESAGNTFKDVVPGKWYTDPILHCVKAGVMSGYDQTTFGTNDNLTREQGAVILAKAFQVEKASGRTAFADDASISTWAVGAVKAMAAKGLISGMGDNRFEPKTPLTRAMMCQIIYAAEKKTDNDSTPKPSENILPVLPADAENIRVGKVVNTTTSDSWDTVVMNYMGEAAQYGFFHIDVDNDDNRELLIFGERGSGNEKLITYHNGNVSVLPLNGASIAYVPKGNAVLVCETENGTNYVSVYHITNGKWTRSTGGSFTDEGDYEWNGKTVTESAFYQAVADSIDVMNLMMIEK